MPVSKSLFTTSKDGPDVTQGTQSESLWDLRCNSSSKMTSRMKPSFSEGFDPRSARAGAAETQFVISSLLSKRAVFVSTLGAVLVPKPFDSDQNLILKPNQNGPFPEPSFLGPRGVPKRIRCREGSQKKSLGKIVEVTFSSNLRLVLTVDRPWSPRAHGSIFEAFLINC